MNLRSVGAGLAAVVLVALVVPYNTHVLANSDLIGAAMPVGAMMFAFLMVVLVNAPLRKWGRPGWALSSGELGTALAMVLVGCAVPNVGLMRYLPGMLTGLVQAGARRPEFGGLMEGLKLPDWLFPATSATDPVVTGYVGRVATFGEAWWWAPWSVPWGAWAVPVLAWGALLAGVFGSVACAGLILRRQWTQGERLEFPIATLCASLIEEPERGRALNRVLSARSFWIASSATLTLHAMSGLALYFPRYVPAPPTEFDLTSVMSGETWRAVAPELKRQALFLSVIGMSFFVQARVTFSIWSIFLATQAIKAVLGGQGAELTPAMEADQTFGAAAGYAAAIAWVARRHLAQVGRHMLGRARPGDIDDAYVPYAWAGWGLVACLGLTFGWLMAVGASAAGALVIVATMMMVYVVAARVTADTGIHPVLPVTLGQPWLMLGQLGWGKTTTGSFFLGQMFTGMFTHDPRQSLALYGAQALVVADRSGAVPPDPTGVSGAGVGRRRGAVALLGALATALVVSLAVSGASMLCVEYRHASTLDRSGTTPINVWPSQGMPEWLVLAPTQAYQAGGPPAAHDRAIHMATGATANTALMVGRLSFANFPLHPVGYLLAYSWGVRMIWFSVLVGWLAKTLILRMLGAKGLSGARPFFTGLIFGELTAAAGWLVINFTLAWAGYEYHAVNSLPR